MCLILVVLKWKISSCEPFWNFWCLVFTKQWWRGIIGILDEGETGTRPTISENRCPNRPRPVFRFGKIFLENLW